MIFRPLTLKLLTLANFFALAVSKDFVSVLCATLYSKWNLPKSIFKIKKMQLKPPSNTKIAGGSFDYYLYSKYALYATGSRKTFLASILDDLLSTFYRKHTVQVFFPVLFCSILPVP